LSFLRVTNLNRRLSNTTVQDHEIGRSISELLAGFWREPTPLPNLSEEDLASMQLRLCRSGAGALAWWSIRDTELARCPAGLELQQVYRRFRLSAKIHEQEITHVFALLRDAGVEPVLVKGWAISRLYPDPGLRPYGDIDLCVPPDQFAKAAATLKCLEKVEGHYVDLHAGFDGIGKGTRAQDDIHRLRRFHRLGGKGNNSLSHEIPSSRGLTFQTHRRNLRNLWINLFERSKLVPLGDQQIRILGDEDHLRALCLHLLRSGAWRPLWLCDVALALETHASDFNWDICLRHDPRQAEWVACTIGLAQELLRANKKFEFRNSTFEIPRWLAPAVLEQWGRDRDPSERATVLPELIWKTRRVRKIFSEFHSRWDNPVRATARTGGRFNNWPRWPYQVLESVLRLPEVVADV
jgi:hypothetical protein